MRHNRRVVQVCEMQGEPDGARRTPFAQGPLMWATISYVRMYEACFKNVLRMMKEGAVRPPHWCFCVPRRLTAFGCLNDINAPL